MKSRLHSILGMVSFCLSMASCSKDDGGGGGGTTPPDPCSGVTTSMSFANDASDPCVGDGRITVTVTNPTGIVYSIDGTTFQTSNIFSNLRAGNYTVRVRTAALCVSAATTTIGNKAEGPLFAAVKPIIAANCAVSGCHNGTTSPNLTADCTIASNSDKIKSRTVDLAGTGLQMPQPPRAALSVADRAKITAWVTAGGKVSN